MSDKENNASSDSELPVPIRYLLVMYSIGIVTSVGAVSQGWANSDLKYALLQSIKQFTTGLSFVIFFVIFDYLWPLFQKLVNLITSDVFKPAHTTIKNLLLIVHACAIIFAIVIGFGHFFCVILVPLDSLLPNSNTNYFSVNNVVSKPYCTEANMIVSYVGSELGEIGLFFREIFLFIYYNNLGVYIFVAVVVAYGILMHFLSRR
jgi:hypothetical protein